jgi:hypothetical protein
VQVAGGAGGETGADGACRGHVGDDECVWVWSNHKISGDGGGAEGVWGGVSTLTRRASEGAAGKMEDQIQRSLAGASGWYGCKQKVGV